MSLLKCRYCGGNIEFMSGTSVFTCWRCRLNQTVPKTINDSNSPRYNEAIELHDEYRFDEAADIYRNIIKHYSREADAYWSLVLNKYGVTYERISKNGKNEYIPVIHRLSDTLIFDDEDYKKVLYLADYNQKSIYRSDALKIYDLQRKMLEDASKSSPCDVFICYNETTTDTMIASELQYLLEKSGYKTFMPDTVDRTASAEETSNNEIRVFPALKSCKVMVVCGTDPDHLTDPITTNDWKRVLSAIQNGANKRIVCVYKGMKADDLPEELRSLPSVDMAGNYSNEEFSDLIRAMMDEIASADEKEISLLKEEEEMVLKQKQAAIDELKKKADSMDELELTLTDEEQREYDKLSDEVKQSEARFLEIKEIYEKNKEEFDALNNDYQTMKKQIDEDPLNAELEELQKQIVARAKSNEENVYFRKKTQEKDAAALNDLFARRNEIEALMDEKHEKLEVKKKNIEIRKKSFASVKGEYESFKKTCEKKQEALDSFDSKIRSSRKKDTLIEIEKLKYTVGETVTFGCWPKDKEPIEWLIVDTIDNTVLLYSKKVIDCVKYNELFTETNWATCTLRKYLNDEFYNNAFSDEERPRIVKALVKSEINPLYRTDPGEDTEDYVFIPSINDIHRYFKEPKDAVCMPSGLAIAKGVDYDRNNGGCYYWLRNLGNANVNAARVSSNGVILEHGFFAGGNDIGVRPVIRLSLEHSAHE